MRNQRPQLLPAFTQIPNLWSDELVYYLTPHESVILGMIYRETFGWQKHPNEERNPISITTLVNGKANRVTGKWYSNGCGYSRTTVQKAVAFLIEAGIIDRIKETNDGSVFWVQDDPNQIDWDLLKHRKENKTAASYKRTEKLSVYNLYRAKAIAPRILAASTTDEKYEASKMTEKEYQLISDWLALSTPDGETATEWIKHAVNSAADDSPLPTADDIDAVIKGIYHAGSLKRYIKGVPSDSTPGVPSDSTHQVYHLTAPPRPGVSFDSTPGASSDSPQRNKRNNYTQLLDASMEKYTNDIDALPLPIVKQTLLHMYRECASDDDANDLSDIIDLAIDKAVSNRRPTWETVIKHIRGLKGIDVTIEDQDGTEVWAALIENSRGRLQVGQIAMIRSCKPVRVHRDALIVTLPDGSNAGWFNNALSPVLVDIARSADGCEGIESVLFTLEEQPSTA